MALQKQLDMEAQEGGMPVPGFAGGPFVMTAPANVMGRLTVTVAEAKLARNYGLARMDPYCRIRVGHCVYETPTCPNGAREPKWNKTFNCFLLQGVTHVDVEVFVHFRLHSYYLVTLRIRISFNIWSHEILVVIKASL